MSTRNGSTQQRSSWTPSSRKAGSRTGASKHLLHIHRSTRHAPLPAARLRHVLRTVLKDEQVIAAEISVAIVDDAEIHRVNREHLDHDCPTDVISFLYSADAAAESRPVKPARRGAGLSLEGELVVSGETAAREAPAHQSTAAAELELYLVHGLLHLCGYDDLSPAERRVMRRREREVLALLAPPTR